MTLTKIMIVEDEGVVAMHLSRTITRWGYEVTSISATADAAIQKADETSPDLVLMDIGLKGGLDGIEAAKKIRETHDVPVVYLTAYRDGETLERAKATDPYGYAIKPFDEHELKITIEMALYRHRADLALRRRNEWLDATLSSVGEGMIATDASGRVRIMNEHAETLMGWPQKEAFSNDITEVLREPVEQEPIHGEDDPEAALRRADSSMYRAKAEGRNRYAITPDSEVATEGWRRFPEEELRRAVESSELEIYLQPIFELGTGNLTGAEALVRWNHPLDGLITASKFIRAAERFGVLPSIVDLSLRQACTAATTCLRSQPDMTISVNLSQTDLRRRDLVSVVSSILDGAALPAGHLEVEISERSPTEADTTVAAENIKKLGELGVPVSLDGFGREFGSMLTMTTQPVRTIKIDRSLISGLPNDSRSVEIVKATVDISEALNVTVVAVGVENEEQMHSLREAGCHQVQGNFLGTPVSTQDFIAKYVM